MAALYCTVPFSTVALVAATAKTVVGINPIANMRVRVLETKVSFDGATSSNAPALVEFNSCTFGANPPGTASSSVTPNKKDKDAGETVQTAAAKAWTTEPTTLVLMDSTDVGQFNGCGKATSRRSR